MSRARMILAAAYAFALALDPAGAEPPPSRGAQPQAKPGARPMPPGIGPIPGAKGDTVLYFQGSKPIGWTVTQANGTQTHFDSPPHGEVLRHLRNDPKQPVTMRLTFVNGAKTHAVLYQRAGVKSMEMQLKGDVQHGIWKSFHPNGRVRDSCSKVEGLTQGTLFTFDENGKLVRKETWKDGRQEGITEEFYPQGPKKSETRYRAGMRDGPYAVWALNGQVMTRGSYSMGVPSGTWEEVYPNGQVSARSRLADWRILERKCFRPEGSPEPCQDDDEEAKALEGMRRNWERDRARLSSPRPRPAPPRDAKPVPLPSAPAKQAPGLPAPPPPDRLGK